jgi:hypothetical protein
MPIVRRLDPTVESILVVEMELWEQECFAGERVVIGTGYCVGEQDCHIAGAAGHKAVVEAAHIVVGRVRCSCHIVAECLVIAIDLDLAAVGYCIGLAVIDVAADTVDIALVDVVAVGRNHRILQDYTPRISDEILQQQLVKGTGLQYLLNDRLVVVVVVPLEIQPSFHHP